MVRTYLMLVVLTLLLAVSHSARRKPEQLACATDFYAKAVVPVKNINRKWRGMPQFTCPANSAVAWLP